MSLAFAAFLCSCGDDSSNSEDDGGFSGGYSESKELSKADSVLFEEVTKNFTEYTLLDPESVAIQSVAGINYKFLCSMQLDGDSVKVYVTIFEPLPGEGKPQITEIVEVNSDKEPIYENPVVPNEEGEDEQSSDSAENSSSSEEIEDESSSSEIRIDESSSSSEIAEYSSSSSVLIYSSSAIKGNTGSYSGYRELTEDDEVFFVEVVKGYEKELINPELVSTQIVSGMNYKFLCSMKDGDVTSKVIVTIYKPFSGDPQITSVEEAPES